MKPSITIFKMYDFLKDFVVWGLHIISKLLISNFPFYYYQEYEEDECEYISSQMMTVPELDFEKIDNFVYDELEILRLK